jgi:hypothetical protein
MAATLAEPINMERTLEALRRWGNPFRNYFARNPDDEICARYHVPELFALQREQLLDLVESYRAQPSTHSEIVPILGNKGAGKTHLLYSIKHGTESTWQLLVTPGSYQRETDFLEYLLFQVIDTLLGGGKQGGVRPLTLIGEVLVRRLLREALASLNGQQRLELFPVPGLGRWARRLGLGSTQAQERTQWLIDSLGKTGEPRSTPGAILHACEEVGLDLQNACDALSAHIDRTETHNAAGLMRRRIFQGFCRSVLLGDDAELANFLTFGFAELDFKVRPTRQDLVLALFKAIMEVFRELHVPVVIAFDQLEDLLLARRSEECHRTAEAFFAGIVQVMHQIDGLCFLIFAERGLWNRFVPSLDGYIQDRLNNPVHLPKHGTVKALRLEAPPPDLVLRVVEARLRPSLEAVAEQTNLPAIFPFTEDQISRIARTEPTLRDMLQQYRHLFDHVIYGETTVGAGTEIAQRAPGAETSTERLGPFDQEMKIKSFVVVDSAATSIVASPSAADESTTAGRTPLDRKTTPGSAGSRITPQQSTSFGDIWDQELLASRGKLEPEGALTGATRELQSALGSFLQLCHEHGVKVGPWRLQHVVNEWTFGDHPTYGAITIAHWVCKDGQPWKVGIGLFLGKGAAKPRDLAIKLLALEAEPPVIDHLILLRPADDIALTGKSKSCWQDAEKRGRHARLEAVDLDGFARLYAFPRWLTAITEALPSGQPLPNAADLLQEKCEKLLEQVCMPVQGS